MSKIDEVIEGFKADITTRADKIAEDLRAQLLDRGEDAVYPVVSSSPDGQILGCGYVAERVIEPGRPPQLVFVMLSGNGAD